MKEDSKSPKQQAIYQIPIDSRPGYITELTFSVASGAVAFRTIATNITTVGTYTSGTEYWYTRSQAVSSSMTMAGSVAQYTSAQLDSFHSDSASAFTWAQAIGTAGWTQGTYTPTTGKTATLFKAPDPDNSTQWVGVLFEQQRSNLTKVVWYKTSDTGTIWAATPSSLSWQEVLNSSGHPSTNPNDISATTWYYAAS